MNRKGLSIVLLLSLGAPYIQVLAQEEPDLEKEARFHQIYKNYNEAPTSEESWSKALGGKNAQTYSVQKGDTLWDISNTFFGDPQYWPKVWSLNKSSILNPHDIGSNMSISFFPGSSAAAPTLDLAQNTETSDALVDTSVGTDAATAPSVPGVEDTSTAFNTVKKAKSKKKVSVLKELPQSLPRLNIGIPRASKTPVEIPTLVRSYPQPFAYLSYFVADTPVVGVGEVTETEMGMKSAMDYQYITVKFNSNITPEKFYIVQKNRGPVIDPHHGDRKAHVVEVQGTVEVLERVNDQEPIFRALVKKTIEQVEVGSILVPGQMPRIDSSAGEPMSGVSARIIGGQFSNDRKMFGENSIVFLDSGSSQGLQEGQVVKVFGDQRLRVEKTKALTNDRAIGTIKVVRTTPNFATAYVLHSEAEFIKGDYVGSPPSQSVKQSKAFSTESMGGAYQDALDDMDRGPGAGNDSNDYAPADTGPSPGGEDLDLEL